jgi:KaiC/GvpD/RAD55 family RecA-like ATPase
MTEETEITYKQGEKSMPVTINKNNPNVRSQMVTLEMNLSQFSKLNNQKISDVLRENLDEIEGVWGVKDQYTHKQELRVTVKYIENDVKHSIKEVVKETKRVVNRIVDREGLEEECVQYIERANKLNINE